VAACTGDTFTSKADLKTAATEYYSDAAAATAKYGAIECWDVSGVTDVSWLFYNMHKFNADISGWNISGVTVTSGMLYVRRSPCTVPKTCSCACAHRNRHLARLPARSPPLISPPLIVMCPACDPRQNAHAFNQPLQSWDTSRVTDMSEMFRVRCAPCTAPITTCSCSPLSCTLRARRACNLPPPARSPYRTVCALLATLGSGCSNSTSR